MKPKRAPKPKRYRKPDQGALHARVSPELAEEFRVWLARTAPRHKYLGQKMGMEGFLTIIVVAAMERMDRRQVDRILDDARPYAERYEHEWNRAQAALEAAEVKKAEMKPPAHETTSGHGARPPRATRGRKRA